MNEFDHMKVVIARHKRKMRKRESGDDVWNIALICVFFLFFGGYISCLAAAFSTK
jgi:hypothetical protein